MKTALLASLAFTLAAPAMANEVDDRVARIAAIDVPAFTDILKAEVVKDKIWRQSDFYIDPAGLTIRVAPKASLDASGIDQARAWGRGICEAMSRSQRDRSFYLAWTVYVLAWRGAVGNPSSGYDPVLKCKLGGETAIETATP
jgi:hypothetical protein